MEPKIIIILLAELPNDMTSQRFKLSFPADVNQEPVPVFHNDLFVLFDVGKHQKLVS